MNYLMKLSKEIADYIISNDREYDDYLEHCDENDLNSEDYLNNATLPGAHVYAKAQALLFEIETAEQKLAESDAEDLKTHKRRT